MALRNGPYIVQRLRWLDDKLYWHGAFQRNDLVARFGISPQQASADISYYKQLAARNARFETANKTYTKAPAYRPIFPKDPFRWMDHGRDENDESVIRYEVLPLLSRQLDHGTVAVLMAAFESRTAVAITYQSLSSAEPSRRIICPHHVVDTGDRSHVRAWDDKRRIFTDFVIGRILSAEPQPEYPWVDAVADVLWNETVDVVLAPHRGLSASQKAIVEREYGMTDGKATVGVRKALVVYLVDRLGLLNAVKSDQGIPDVSRGVQCVNAADIRALLPNGISGTTDTD